MTIFDSNDIETLNKGGDYFKATGQHPICKYYSFTYTIKKLIRFVLKHITDCDAIIVSDKITMTITIKFTDEHGKTTLRSDHYSRYCVTDLYDFVKCMIIKMTTNVEREPENAPVYKDTWFSSSLIEDMTTIMRKKTDETLEKCPDQIATKTDYEPYGLYDHVVSSTVTTIAAKMAQEDNRAIEKCLDKIVECVSDEHTFNSEIVISILAYMGWSWDYNDYAGSVQRGQAAVCDFFHGKNTPVPDINRNRFFCENLMKELRKHSQKMTSWKSEKIRRTIYHTIRYYIENNCSAITKAEVYWSPYTNTLALTVSSPVLKSDKHPICGDKKSVTIDLNKTSMYDGLKSLIDYIEDKYNEWKAAYSARIIKSMSNSLYGTNIGFVHKIMPKNNEEENNMRRVITPVIKNVVFNDPATIVFWSDDTKTVVKSQNGELYDPEKGLAMAIVKKLMGDNQGNYYETIKKWTKKYLDEHPVEELFAGEGCEITETEDIDEKPKSADINSSHPERIIDDYAESITDGNTNWTISVMSVTRGWRISIFSGKDGKYTLRFKTVTNNFEKVMDINDRFKSMDDGKKTFDEAFPAEKFGRQRK